MLFNLSAHIHPVWMMLLPFVVGIPLFYPIYKKASRNTLRFDAYDFWLTTGATYAAFVLFEASFGQLYERYFGVRLWEYRMLPNHQAYGSYLGILMWPLYGIHVYWFRQVMDANVGRLYRFAVVKAAFASIEGPLYEFIGNGLILLVFGRYLFYYLPNDLWHLTTIQVIPLYFVAGIFVGIFYNAMLQAKKSWGLPLCLYVMGICFSLVG